MGKKGGSFAFYHRKKMSNDSVEKTANFQSSPIMTPDCDRNLASVSGTNFGIGGIGAFQNKFQFLPTFLSGIGFVLITLKLNTNLEKIT